MANQIMKGRTETHPWGSMTWLADGASDDSLSTSTARMTVLPHQTSPKHKHATCYEVVSVWAGEVYLLLGDKRVGPLTAHQSVKIPPDLPHAIQNEGKVAADLVITYSSGLRDYIEV